MWSVDACVLAERGDACMAGSVRNHGSISDMTSLPDIIQAHAAGLPEGAVLTAKALLHLGNRAAVDQALGRLTRAGSLLRVGRGAYVAPVSGRFGSHPPEPIKVVEDWARQFGETVLPHGGLSANRLGLTTQVPVQSIFLTSGRSRQLKVGKLKVELRHAPPRTLALGRSRAGEIVRALEWLGREHAGEAVVRMAGTLSAAEKQELLGARPLMPGWLSDQVSRAVGRG